MDLQYELSSFLSSLLKSKCATNFKSILIGCYMYLDSLESVLFVGLGASLNQANCQLNWLELSILEVC